MNFLGSFQLMQERYEIYADGLQMEVTATLVSMSQIMPILIPKFEYLHNRPGFKIMIREHFHH